MTTSFADLIERAECLTGSIAQPQSGIPRIERSLPQILNVGEQLLERSLRGPRVTFAPGSPSVGVPKLDLVLEQLTAATADNTQTVTEETEGNLEQYLKGQREEILASLIDETIQRSFESVERRHWDMIVSSWEQEKRRIFASIPSTLSDIVPAPTVKLTKHDVHTGGRSAMTEMESSFASMVRSYVDHQLEGGSRERLTKLFESVAVKFKDQKFVELWSQVAFMLEADVQAGVDTAKQRISSRFNLSAIERASRYLEMQYRTYMETLVYGNLSQAELGGVPEMQRMLVAYLNVKPCTSSSSEDGAIDGHPTWALVYLALRIGDLRTVIDLCGRAGPTLADFKNAIVELERTQRLSPETENKLKLTYRRFVKTSSDSYKRAVYGLLVGCDWAQDHAGVCDSLEDWLWLKLQHAKHYEQRIVSAAAQSSASTSGTSTPGSGVNVTSSSSATSQARGGKGATSQQGPDSLSLQQLQQIILNEYGEKHFLSSDAPLLFFTCLWLTAQFESAIEFLFRQGGISRVHAVHIALATYQMNLLLYPDNAQAPLCSNLSEDTVPAKRLNLARLVLMYAAKFQDTDPADALYYYYFLKQFKTQKGDNLFLASVNELVVVSKEYDMLLGHMQADGTRRPGYIDRFQLHYNVRLSIEFCARQAEMQGLAERAIQLYDLAGNHQMALELLTTTIAQFASQSPDGNEARLQIGRLAYAIATRYRKHGYTASEEVSSKFFLLLDVLTFFDLYHASRHADALEVIRKLKLIPMRVADVEEHVASFSLMPEQFRKVLADVLVAVMSCLQALHMQMRSHVLAAVHNHDREALQSLRQTAESIILYAGRIPHRLPGDTNARLIQIETMLR